MSRRPLLHPIGQLAKAQGRMAPGGLLWSESPIPRSSLTRRVQIAGEEPPPGGQVVLRPDLIYVDPQYNFVPLDLIGGGGNATLADGSDTTYARELFLIAGGSGIRKWRGAFYADLAAGTLPVGAVITDTSLTMRGKLASGGDVDWVGMTWRLFELNYPGLPTGQTTLHAQYAGGAQPWIPTGAYADYVRQWIGEESQPGIPARFPSPEGITGKKLTLQVRPESSNFDKEVWVSEAALTVSYVT